MTDPDLPPEERLAAHLRAWLGEWPPPAPGLTVVGSNQRERPGWDGRVREVLGVAIPGAAVLSVPPGWLETVRAIGTDLETVAHALPAAVGRPGARVGFGVFRSTIAPAPLPDAGEWVPTADSRVPAWLKPFNDEVLIAWDQPGVYGAGVGRKKHDRWGHELAVVTEAALRGQGIARRLVAQAARRVLDDGAVPTYLHDAANVASAHVAESCGFTDDGWQIIGLW